MQFAITIDHADVQREFKFQYAIECIVDASRYLQSHDSINSNSSQKNYTIRVRTTKSCKKRYLLLPGGEMQRIRFRNNSENLNLYKGKMYLAYKKYK